MINNNSCFQGHANWGKTQVNETAPCIASTENDKPSACFKSCVRLRYDIPQERLQHPHSLHALPSHFCHGWGPAV